MPAGEYSSSSVPLHRTAPDLAISELLADRRYVGILHHTEPVLQVGTGRGQVVEGRLQPLLCRTQLAAKVIEPLDGELHHIDGLVRATRCGDVDARQRLQV